MKYGNWVPISKGFIKSLPKDRSYTELEAAYCLQLDYDNKNKATITGYANLWRWSVGKVYRFFERMNIKVEYPETTKKKQNQNGMIIDMIPEGCRNDTGMIRLIKNNNLQNETEGKRNDNGMITEGSQTTTIEPKNLKPNKNLKHIAKRWNKKDTTLYDRIRPDTKHTDNDNDNDNDNKKETPLHKSFVLFWDEYPKKKSKGSAEKVWNKIKPDKQMVDNIIIKIKELKNSTDWIKENGQYIPHPATWLNAKGWEDDVQITIQHKPKMYTGDPYAD